MGKGDQKSRRGKINAGSYGKKRPRKGPKSVAIVKEKPKKEVTVEPKATKAKAEKAEAAAVKPKVARKKKTEE